MCEATTIAYIAAAVISGVSAYSAAESQQASAEYQSQVAQNNADSADEAARDAIKRGEIAAQNQRRKNSQLLGTQRAVQAARGLDIGEGSALAILEDTAYFGEVDEQTIRDNAAREAWGISIQGGNYKAQAGLLDAQANGINPLFSGATAAAGSYLGSGGTVSGKWFEGSGGYNYMGDASGAKFSQTGADIRMRR